MWQFLICYITQTPQPQNQAHNKYVKLQTVTNLPQLRATRMLYPDLCSIFRVDSHCSSHFAVAPQKTSVFDQNLTIDSLNHFKYAQKI